MCLCVAKPVAVELRCHATALIKAMKLSLCLVQAKAVKEKGERKRKHKNKEKKHRENLLQTKSVTELQEELANKHSNSNASLCKCPNEPCHEKSDTNQAVQPLKVAIGLKLHI